MLGELVGCCRPYCNLLRWRGNGSVQGGPRSSVKCDTEGAWEMDSCELQQSNSILIKYNNKFIIKASENSLQSALWVEGSALFSSD